MKRLALFFSLILCAGAVNAAVDTMQSATYFEDTYINRNATTNNYGGSTILIFADSGSSSGKQKTFVMAGVKNFNTWKATKSATDVTDSIILQFYIVARTANRGSMDTVWDGTTQKIRRFFYQGNLTGGSTITSRGMTWVKYSDSSGSTKDSSWTTAGAGSTTNDIISTSYAPGIILPAASNWWKMNLTTPINADENAHFKISISQAADTLAHDTIQVASIEYTTDATKKPMVLWFHHAASAGNLVGTRYRNTTPADRYKDRRG